MKATMAATVRERKRTFFKKMKKKGKCQLWSRNMKTTMAATVFVCVRENQK
jgi:hypothetical protein